MKIALVITGLSMGGAEKQVCALADKLAIDHDVMLISLSPDKVINTPRNKNIQLISLEMKKTPYGFIHAIIRTKKILNKFKPDIIHSHMFHANIFARVLRLFYNRAPLITTAHSSNEGGTLRMFGYRITDCMSTITTNVSEEAVTSFIEKKAVKKNKIIAMYNGIDTELFIYSEINRTERRQELNISNNTPLLLAVGRLTKAKDYPNLLKAFSSISVTNQAHLAIIGDGEEKDNLISLAKELNVYNKIHWLGLKKNVHEWMSACDLFILSSAWEGFGLVVAEAMSCQRIVIGTDCGGVKEVIGNNGFVVPPNDPKALSLYIEKALALSSIEKKNIELNARKHIKNNFSLDSIIKKWISLYSKLTKTY
ncbi:glycosyltransferase [Providencia stuartii]|uniref:glycosyltransferase n=1 Tax=Providencia stuartii TaxID=588 RepID=UPI0024B23D85|nr:glycosyltransferase [Providencia stuartii]ELR5082558.1 glycosyltransferase [Providencia stuartii]